jgi:hypothetical protein
MGGMPEDPGNGGVLRAVREVDWAAYAMPPSAQWYEPGKVLAAFRRLVAVSTRQKGRAASSAVLFAIGNDHEGTLYPAAAPAAPLLVPVAREHQGWVRWVALEILIDCLDFGPDREQFIDPSGAAVRTRDAILTAVQGMRQDLGRLAQQETDICAGSARVLLEQLDYGLTAGR